MDVEMEIGIVTDNKMEMFTKGRLNAPLFFCPGGKSKAFARGIGSCKPAVVQGAYTALACKILVVAVPVTKE